MCDQRRVHSEGDVSNIDRGGGGEGTGVGDGESEDEDERHEEDRMRGESDASTWLRYDVLHRARCRDTHPPWRDTPAADVERPYLRLAVAAVCAVRPAPSA